MISTALHRLLTDRAYRAAFLEGRHAELGLSQEDLKDLSTIAPDQLREAATTFRDDLLRRQHRGTGSLRTLYRETLEHLDPAEVISCFMESSHYDAYRETLHAGIGLCLEEAFYRFCEADGIGESTVREREYLTAIARALLFSPRPGFRLPGEFHWVPGGFVAVATHGESPVLCAAVRGRLLTGPLTQLLADLLAPGAVAQEVGSRHGVSAEALAAAQGRLQEMGLAY
jgi:hypothetical protein